MEGKIKYERCFKKCKKKRKKIIDQKRMKEGLKNKEIKGILKY